MPTLFCTSPPDQISPQDQNQGKQAQNQRRAVSTDILAFIQGVVDVEGQGFGAALYAAADDQDGSELA
jgi:hypothetical protein